MHTRRAQTPKRGSTGEDEPLKERRGSRPNYAEVDEDGFQEDYLEEEEVEEAPQHEEEEEEEDYVDDYVYEQDDDDDDDYKEPPAKKHKVSAADSSAAAVPVGGMAAAGHLRTSSRNKVVKEDEPLVVNGGSKLDNVPIISEQEDEDEEEDEEDVEESKDKGGLEHDLSSNPEQAETQDEVAGESVEQQRNDQNEEDEDELDDSEDELEVPEVSEAPIPDEDEEDEEQDEAGSLGTAQDEDEDEDEDDENSTEYSVSLDMDSKETTADIPRRIVRSKMLKDIMDVSQNNEVKKEVLTEEEIQLRKAENARKRKNIKDKKLEEEKRDTINKLLKKRARKARTRQANDDNNRQLTGQGSAVNGDSGEELSDFIKHRRPYISDGMTRTVINATGIVYCPQEPVTPTTNKL